VHRQWSCSALLEHSFHGPVYTPWQLSNLSLVEKVRSMLRAMARGVAYVRSMPQPFSRDFEPVTGFHRLSHDSSERPRTATRKTAGLP
jgi:hypothetical protein